MHSPLTFLHIFKQCNGQPVLRLRIVVCMGMMLSCSVLCLRGFYIQAGLELNPHQIQRKAVV